MRLYLAGQMDAPLPFYGFVANYVTNLKCTPTSLDSFYYCAEIASQKHTEAFIENYHKSDCDWIMDSGVFTMMFGRDKDKNHTYKSIKEYTDRYIRFLKSFNYSDYVVEMDVHKILGMDAVFKLRELLLKYFSPDKIIFVWHTEEGYKGLIKLAQERPYIALGLPELRKEAKRIREPVKTVIRRLLHLIKTNTDKYPKVHLLGCTEPSIMSNPYYATCDSSSWLGGIRYNQILLFDNGYLRKGSMYSKPYQEYLNKMKPKIMRGVEIYTNRNPHIANVVDKVISKPRTLNALVGAITFTQLQNHINERYYAGQVH
mgnify:CR=1 FL=1